MLENTVIVAFISGSQNTGSLWLSLHDLNQVVMIVVFVSFLLGCWKSYERNERWVLYPLQMFIFDSSFWDCLASCHFCLWISLFRFIIRRLNLSALLAVFLTVGWWRSWYFWIDFQPQMTITIIGLSWGSCNLLIEHYMFMC